MRLTRVLIFVTTLVVGFSAAADELLMKDGSRLLGKVIKKDDSGTVSFKTSYAGVINVKWTEIAELNADEPMIVLLNSGETHKVVSAKSIEAGIVVVYESGATGTISDSEVGYINPEPWRLGRGWTWTGNINAVLDYERGNTDTDEYEADIDMMFRKIDNRLKVYGDYDRETKNKNLTDDNWRMANRYDHFVNEKLYYGAVLGLEHDRFADLSLRTIVGPTVGYEFYEGKVMNLDIGAGLAYVIEDFYIEDNRNYEALVWHFDFDRFLIPDRVQFYHRHRGLLEIKDKDNVIWDAWTGFRFPIYAGIVASTELLLEYDGGAARGVDKMDTTYKVKLGYTW